MQANGIFITGTGTDVGKTIITATILRLLRLNGIDAVPMKPVQSGALPTATGLKASDLHVSLNAAELSPSASDLTLMAPYVYEPACSPHLAGRMTKSYPDMNHILSCVSELQKRHQAVLIEGAGGIMVPINESETMLDLMQLLNCPVVLVAHNSLGTINHTLLSIQALQNAGLHILGIVFNDTSAPDPDTEFIRRENPDAIAAFSNVPILGHIRFRPEISSGNSAAWDHTISDLSDTSTLLNSVS